MNNNDVQFIEITRTYSAAELAMIKAILEEAEIPYFIVDEFSGLLGTCEGYIVKVEDIQADLARELIQENSGEDKTPEAPNATSHDL